MASRDRVHLIIPTHTTRHLAACIAAISRQEHLPASVTVTCDGDDPEIAAVLDAIWPRVVLGVGSRGEPPMLVHTFRAHQGEARLNQVRNNGLRAAANLGVLGDEDLLVVLDGDTVLEERALRLHAQASAQGADVVVPFRVDLDVDRTNAVHAGALLERTGACAGPLCGLASRNDMRSLATRHSRYARQLALRSMVPRGLGLIKGHKPKVLGGHHAVRVRTMRAVNGYDECFVGYGYDDDDLSLRLHMLVPRPHVRIAVREILAFHLWHPSRAPASPTESPMHARFTRPDVCEVAEHGWRTPRAQPIPEVRVVPADRSRRMAVLSR